MNYINRVLVKQQAKGIIKNKVFKLFIISLIVGLITGSSGSINIANNQFSKNIIDNDSSKNDYYDDYDYYDDFDYYDENPIENFGQEFEEEFGENFGDEFNLDNNRHFPNVFGIDSLKWFPIAIASVTTGIISFLLGPLAVTLAGFYLALIKRSPEQELDLGKEIIGIFKNTFNKSYLKKLVLMLILSILTALLFCLFIVPGIIFCFSAYFVYQIMCENPNLKPTEAIALSRKMIRGNRTELFVMNLSFIPWALLTVCTFGLAAIYVVPYKSTVDALYYENFKLRALNEGRITQDDFLSAEEKAMRYNQYQGYEGQQQNYYYQRPDEAPTQPNAQPFEKPTEQEPNQQENENPFYSPDDEQNKE